MNKYNLLPDVASKNCWRNENSVDPHEMLCSVVSYLGLHCLPRPVYLNTANTVPFLLPFKMLLSEYFRYGPYGIYDILVMSDRV